MALRLVEIVLPAGENRRLQQIVEEARPIGHWRQPADDDCQRTSVLVRAEQTEALLDALSAAFASYSEFRVVVLATEALLPRPEEPKKAPEAPEPPQEGRTRSRISRHEIYEDVAQGAALTPVFLSLTVISTLVACVGLMRSNVAVVIGAMVIAPLLGPNVAFALATTLWDRALLALAARANGVGAGIAFVLSLAVGFFVVFDPSTPEIASRTQVGFADVLLALASGIAGVLALTAGLPSSLIGVMVAVALLPPLATFGLLIGSGHFHLAGGALLLLVVNVVCVNLAGVVTFLVQGVRPRRGWVAERAARGARIAVALWVSALLAVLVWIFLGAPVS
jgi:uncharacterized hydrophobic protein (TIGR00341 family)